MIDLLQNILAFIVALGVLITFHEFGHYWVARRCDVKILRFSIGFGRAISDGVYQAAIYDCAVLPEFQGKGIGTAIMKNIMSRVSHCNVILYATPGKEGFYKKHGFRKMKTGMAHFKRREKMTERGFTE